MTNPTLDLDTNQDFRSRLQHALRDFLWNYNINDNGGMDEVKNFRECSAEATDSIITLIEEAESRGRVAVISSMKEWADKTEVTYNEFMASELDKVKEQRTNLRIKGVRDNE